MVIEPSPLSDATAEAVSAPDRGALTALMDFMATWTPEVERRLRLHLTCEAGPNGAFSGPLVHLLEGGGKRFRPLLTLAACELVGGDPADAMDVACAIEYFHTSSLILDDLPCMDDASERRGVPALHVAYGEATAILTALVLFNLAHRLLSSGVVGRVSGHELHATVSKSIGANGMIGGQHVDLLLAGRHASSTEDDELRLLKTSALISAALAAGAHVGGGEASAIDALSDFGNRVGCAFQIRDDDLDAVQDHAVGDTTQGETAESRIAVAVNRLRAAFPRQTTARTILEEFGTLAISRTS